MTEAMALSGRHRRQDRLEDLKVSLIRRLKVLSCEQLERGQQSRRPISWALGLQGFWLKGALHLLFGIETVCVFNSNRFFGIIMPFAFMFLHFECNFGFFFLYLGAFIVYNCAVEFRAVFINELVVAGCIVPSDGFLGTRLKGRGTFYPYSIKKGA